MKNIFSFFFLMFVICSTNPTYTSSFSKQTTFPYGSLSVAVRLTHWAGNWSCVEEVLETTTGKLLKVKLTTVKNNTVKETYWDAAQGASITNDNAHTFFPSPYYADHRVNNFKVSGEDYQWGQLFTIIGLCLIPLGAYQFYKAAQHLVPKGKKKSNLPDAVYCALFATACVGVGGYLIYIAP